ncbi:DUF5682 family protein [Streptomyces globosus]|uniref:DUF5682 family protein n=1 Tax=Streptomyces globosus TaxID=68209 RepID=UPI003638727B
MSPAAPAARRGPLLLGIRHHGPGSARAVRAALEAARPAAVLVEGPPEGDALLPLAADPGMRPPVALLSHAADDPGRAVFWPLAAFSPEWAAIRWAQEQQPPVPVRFVDLPAAHTLAAAEAGEAGEPAGGTARPDPLGALAAAAGYEDPERWWEDTVELRGGPGDAPADPLAVFEALGDAMEALRGAHPEDASGTIGGRPRDLVREAHMRQRIRAARREFGDGCAVVCGAWHVPALRAATTAAADKRLLAGLPRTRVETAWVPWTHRRLARTGGYGAGVAAPGWYAHLAAAPDRPVERWMARAAALLREEDLPVSPAHVIEAVRLAGTLAAVRGRPAPGLAETLDAVRAVMCGGSEVPLALVEDRLVVGDVLGRVPDGAPAVPLQRDLARQQRSLRLKAEPQERELELDLRGPTDAARSLLLHRLRLLGIGWGRPAASRPGTGTFRETWRLRWEPELAVRVAEAGIWGTTVLAAAGAKAAADAAAARELADVTALAERCLLAGLSEALPQVLRALADLAALDTDAARLAQALPALARALRYGDVRGTAAPALRAVARGLAERICVALPPACAAGLDAGAAAGMRGHVEAVHGAVGLLDDEDLQERWAAVLAALGARDGVPGAIRGRAVRLLLDEGRLPVPEAARLMGLALSPAAAPADAAGWIDGFAGAGAGGGTLLVHDDRLFGLIDQWLAAVPADAFTDVLPLLRRTFGAYEPGVRRTLGELARRGPGARRAAAGAGTPEGFAAVPDAARADAAADLARLLLAAADRLAPQASPSGEPALPGDGSEPGRRGAGREPTGGPRR